MDGARLVEQPSRDELSAATEVVLSVGPQRDAILGLTAVSVWACVSEEVDELCAGLCCDSASDVVDAVGLAVCVNACGALVCHGGDDDGRTACAEHGDFVPEASSVDRVVWRLAWCYGPSLIGET